MQSLHSLCKERSTMTSKTKSNAVHMCRKKWMLLVEMVGSARVFGRGKL